MLAVGWLMLPLGQAALYSYIVHFFLILLVYNLAPVLAKLPGERLALQFEQIHSSPLCEISELSEIRVRRAGADVLTGEYRTEIALLWPFGARYGFRIQALD